MYMELKNHLLNNLFWEKYRPTTIEDTIILPRILPIFEKPLTMNLLFTGSSGIGKTTCARILLQKYDYLYINASKENSIDNLREDITNFCSTYSIHNEYDFKVVFLDEFDGASNSFQEGLKAFIEDKGDRIRWVAICNTIKKIIPALKSRFTIINFNCQNNEEEKWLKTKYAQRILKISNDLNIQISKDKIVELVKHTFPDMRSILNNLQFFSICPDISLKSSGEDFKNSLFSLILTKCDSMLVWEWVMANCDNDSKYEITFDYLGSDFFQYCFEIGIDTVLFGELILKYNEYIPIKAAHTDPVIPLTGLMYSFQMLIQSKKKY